MGRSVLWETTQKLFSFEISLRNPWVYGASKAFVLSFSEALALEYRGHQVRMMALCPGSVQTHFFDALGGKDPAVASGARVLTPEQVVQAALDGLERGRSSVIPGKANTLIPLIARLLPRHIYLRLTEKVLRSALPSNKGSTEVKR